MTDKSYPADECSICTTGPLSVQCPVCWAGIGIECVTVVARLKSKPHSQRLKISAKPPVDDFIAQIARLQHSGDDGWTQPDDPDDNLHVLDSLIAQARQFRGGVA